MNFIVFLFLFFVFITTGLPALSYTLDEIGDSRTATKFSQEPQTFRVEPIEGSDCLYRGIVPANGDCWFYALGTSRLDFSDFLKTNLQMPCVINFLRGEVFDDVRRLSLGTEQDVVGQHRIERFKRLSGFSNETPPEDILEHHMLLYIQLVFDTQPGETPRFSLANQRLANIMALFLGRNIFVYEEAGRDMKSLLRIACDVGLHPETSDIFQQGNFQQAYEALLNYLKTTGLTENDISSIFAAQGVSLENQILLVLMSQTQFSETTCIIQRGDHFDTLLGEKEISRYETDIAPVMRLLYARDFSLSVTKKRREKREPSAPYLNSSQDGIPIPPPSKRPNGERTPPGNDSDDDQRIY